MCAAERAMSEWEGKEKAMSLAIKPAAFQPIKPRCLFKLTESSFWVASYLILHRTMLKENKDDPASWSHESTAYWGAVSCQPSSYSSYPTCPMTHYSNGWKMSYKSAKSNGHKVSLMHLLHSWLRLGIFSFVSFVSKASRIDYLSHNLSHTISHPVLIK